MRRQRVVLALCFALVACTHRVAPPTEALDLAVARVAKGDVDARSLAFAGYHSLLVDGSADKAKWLFDQSLGKDPGEPYALYGQLLLAERVEHPERALAAALELCERAPTHPLAAGAARLVLDLTNIATSMDDTIAQRAPKILERGIPGDAAHLLRSALATIAMARGDLEGNRVLLAEMGVPQAFSLLGPFSPWHVLGMAEPTAAETAGSLEHLTGPFGPLVPRAVQVADGRFTLAGEPQSGDVYVVAVDFDVHEAGSYVVRSITSMDNVVVVDGTRLIERLTWQRPAPTLAERALTLTVGTHRLLVRASKEEQNGQITVAVMRLDGRPAQVTFRPATGAAASWAGVVPLEDAPHLYPSAAALHAALVDEAGDALARFLAARDAMGRDRDGAGRLLSELPDVLAGPTVSVLRADLALHDRTVPQKVARGRATRDLEAALAKDRGNVKALMATAQLALDDGRQLDALEQVKVARAAGPAGAPLLYLQAKVELAMGLDAQAATTVHEAVKALPGHCDALLIDYDVARRRDAAALADQLLEDTARCPGALSRSAEHRRTRGDVEGAITAWKAYLARDESQVPITSSLVGLLIAQRRYDEALTLLERLEGQWPRNERLLKLHADVLEHAARPADALAVRERALALDGADLSLRRATERAKTGKELLDEYAISTDEALKAYEAAPGLEDVTSAFLLDAAAIRAYPDGTQVDRIHIIQKAMDQQGVQEVAEVQIPQGAQVLKLRTLKADGSTLEPDAIDEKEAFSMPGVQVGDLVEYEYLLAHPPRGPAQPGFTSSNFYFQVARQPNNWSTYKVIAPKGSHLKVDAHNMEAQPAKAEGDVEVFSHEERRVRPFIPEPMGPPSGNEWLPFVSIGAGQLGNDGLVTTYADTFADNGLITSEVEAFARAAAKGTIGRDAVRAVYVAVMQKLSGRDAGLGVSASASVSQDRGSRTWLLKASLAALGFDVRLAAVRAFTGDPAPYLFPAEGLLPYVCVRVTLTDGSVVWLDPLVRYAPFGELPEFALGERDAYLLPEPKHPLEAVKTPPRNPRPGKEVRLSLKLSDEGVLEGDGEETYAGFDAAQLAEALESVSPDQRDQALQGALSRYFGGADLSHIDIDAKREVGAPVRVKYHFVARRFGRREGDKRMVLGGVTFPSLVGRRFLVTSGRTTPLMIEGSEGSRTVATLTLPQGWTLSGPVPEVKLSCQWGSYVRHEAQTGASLSIDEEYHLTQSRVPPDKYEVFGQFAGEVDLMQGRDLLIERR